MQEATGKTGYDLEEEFAVDFYRYYEKMLWDTYNSIGKDIHSSSIARFNLVYNQGSEDNNFDRVIKFAEFDNDLGYCASICRAVGNILSTIGLFSNALRYYKKALAYQDLKEKD